MPELAEIHKSDRQVQQNVLVMGSETCQGNHIIAGIKLTILKEKIKKKNDSWVSGMSSQVNGVGIFLRQHRPKGANERRKASFKYVEFEMPEIPELGIKFTTAYMDLKFRRKTKLETENKLKLMKYKIHVKPC